MALLPARPFSTACSTTFLVLAAGPVSTFRRTFVSSPVRGFPPRKQQPSLAPQNADITKIRNLGIFAHIDSGKTTLTESVLVHSGYIPHPGTVDLGTTSTDFLPAERERGITIQSASIPVQWAGHTVNVVDTPGHVDFTMEVERAARVVDGAVVVMDGVEGVEGQTEGVWKQLTRYNVLSRLLFVNKLDRAGASLPHSLISTGNRLHPLPLVLTLPITSFDSANGKGGEPGIVGLVDIVGGKIWRWSGRRGEEVKEEARIFDEFTTVGETFPWEVPAAIPAAGPKKGAAPAASPSATPSFLPLDHPIRAEAVAARTALVETLSTHHLPLLEEFFDVPSPESDIPSHLLLPPASLRAAIRALTLTGEALPVFCGSAFKGIGVEALLDGIVQYLPCPGDVGPAMVVGGAPAESDEGASGKKTKKGGAGWKGKTRGNKALAVNKDKIETSVAVSDPRVVALAFKVVWDEMRGWMTFVRVYSGTLTKGNLYNTSVGEAERPTRLLLLYANNPVDVESLPPGSIGVLLGLKHTRTGDTLLSGTDPRRLPPQPTRLRGVEIPNSVCSVAIQMNGREEANYLGAALDRLVRQDPSLRLEWPQLDDRGEQIDPEAQTLLHGMGQLHLEISLRRLHDEQGVVARAGRMRVSLRESVVEGGGPVEVTETWEGSVVGVPGQSRAKVKMEVERLTDEDLAQLRREGQAEALADWAGNDVVLDIPMALAPLEQSLTSSMYAAITRGGPLMSLPLSHLRVVCTPIFEGGEDGTLVDTLPSSSSSSATTHHHGSFSEADLASLPPPAAYARAINLALRSSLEAAGPRILEPILDTKIWGVSPNDLGRVVTDLIGRGGAVSELGDEEMSTIGSTGGAGAGAAGEGEKETVYIPSAMVSPSASNLLSSGEREQRRTVLARVPLAEMNDYAGRLRSLSGGGGVFETAEGGWGEVDVSTVRKREERAYEE